MNGEPEAKRSQVKPNSSRRTCRIFTVTPTVPQASILQHGLQVQPSERQSKRVYDDMDVLLDPAFCKMVILSNLCLPYHLTDFNCMFAQQQSEMDRLRQPLGTISQIVGNVGKNPTEQKIVQ
jgi:hypothetical protein